jgi:hypothetical protein
MEKEFRLNAAKMGELAQNASSSGRIFVPTEELMSRNAEIFMKQRNLFRVLHALHARYLDPQERMFSIAGAFYGWDAVPGTEKERLLSAQNILGGALMMKGRLRGVDILINRDGSKKAIAKSDLSLEDARKKIAEYSPQFAGNLKRVLDSFGNKKMREIFETSVDITVLSFVARHEGEAGQAA